MWQFLALILATVAPMLSYDFKYYKFDFLFVFTQVKFQAEMIM